MDEADEEGGSRSFTLFSSRGHLEYESGADFEHEIARAGHYPEARSENKGNEPEGLAVARFGGRTLLFVGSERANAVGVYEMGKREAGVPPAAAGRHRPRGPEGSPQARPARGDRRDRRRRRGLRDQAAGHALQAGARRRGVPGLESVDRGGAPVPWVAMSGLSGDPWDRDTVWAVSDSFLGQAYLYGSTSRTTRRGSSSGSRSAALTWPTRPSATTTSRACSRGPRAGSGSPARDASPTARAPTSWCASMTTAAWSSASRSRRPWWPTPRAAGSRASPPRAAPSAATRPSGQ